MSVNSNVSLCILGVQKQSTRMKYIDVIHRLVTITYVDNDVS